MVVFFETSNNRNNSQDPGMLVNINPDVNIFILDIHGPDQDDSAAFTSEDASGTETVTLSNPTNGDKISCKLLCKSFRNLYSERVIGPITYITEASNTDSANIYVVPYSKTYHGTRGNYLPSASIVWFRWDGIVDPIGIDFCEVMFH